LMWFGLASPWLVLITDKLGRENAESRETEGHLRRKLLVYAGISMLAAVVLIVVDLLVAFW
jgi:hypothetical protein